MAFARSSNTDPRVAFDGAPLLPILIRGLPGAGKSTLAKALAAAHGYIHDEADQFLVVDGRYQHAPARVPSAHIECLATARAALGRGQRVELANTFAKIWELRPYIELGTHFAVFVARVRWRNEHGVPDEKIAVMRTRWEPLPRDLRQHLRRLPAAAVESLLGRQQ